MAAGNTFQGNLNITMNGTLSETTGLVTAGAPLGKSIVKSIASGLGAGDCDTLYTEAGTLAASTPRIIQIHSSTTLFDPLGNLLVLASCKLLYIGNLDPTDAFPLTVGGAASTPWNGCLPGTSTIIIQPGGGLLIWGFGSVGMVVTSGSQNLELNPGANAVPYELVIWGIS